MERDKAKARFKAVVAEYLEKKGITDVDIRKDTSDLRADGRCLTVAAYIEKLAEKYFGSNGKESRGNVA
jgi:hypothetical protein